MFGLTMAQAPQQPQGGAAVQASPPTADDLSPQDVLRVIVDNVNAILSRTYSLVDFDSLRDTELLQVVADLFATLQPSMAMELDANTMPEAVPQMLDFLIKTLGYHVPPFIQGSFPQSFADAEPTVVYPALYWVVTRMEQNTKRVYLARFLQPLDIPEDIRAQDEDVRSLFMQHQQLRAAFTQIHRRVDALRAVKADPAELRRRVTALEEEREQLQGYIEAAERRLAGVPDREALLAASKSLRGALEENTRLAEKKVEQEQAKISAELRGTEISNRLQNLRRDASDGRVEMMVRRMKDEIQTNRIKLDEQLPLEVDAKKKENAELQKLVSEPLDMGALTLEEKQLNDALKELYKRMEVRQRPAEDGTSIATIKQQVERLAANKTAVLTKLSSLQADNSRALNEIRDREASIQQLRQATNMLKGDDFKEFSNQVRAKKSATEGMRTRLAELRAEWGTLTFTEATLQAQYNELDAAIGDLESKLGLQGYSRTVEALSKLTHEKDTIEEVKGKTLEELSRVVQDFTLAIREGRTRLAPLINELRTVRQTAAEVDQEWSERKSQYDYQESLLMEDIQKIDDEVTKLKEETRVNESLFHRLTTQSMLLQAQAKRASEEVTFRARPDASLDPQYKTYSDYFADVSRMLEARTKDLQVKRRAIEEHHDTNVQQVEWFNSLRRVLEVKVKCMQDANNAANGNGARANTLDQDIQQVLGVHGADMLVLNNN